MHPNCQLFVNIETFLGSTDSLATRPRPNLPTDATIVAVSGLALADGFILVQAHAYVLMRKDRGFLCMSDIKLVVPDWFVKLFKNKIGSPATISDVLLRADKVTAEVAVATATAMTIASDAAITAFATGEHGLLEFHPFLKNQNNKALSIEKALQLMKSSNASAGQVSLGKKSDASLPDSCKVRSGSGSETENTSSSP
ncbi:hypothetical protein L2E82_26909 [Cichorium intybus]|uniref:Uncharacterized protein n=1 Tax=Cichorium intybus TaxID=13427 RepID=A0ACB9CRM5_CICIN|nr:hypothetical protein L2E82_26909 [Cichorium intybus]